MQPLFLPLPDHARCALLHNGFCNWTYISSAVVQSHHILPEVSDNPHCPFHNRHYLRNSAYSGKGQHSQFRKYSARSSKALSVLHIESLDPIYFPQYYLLYIQDPVFLLSPHAREHKSDLQVAEMLHVLPQK